MGVGLGILQAMTALPTIVDAGVSLASLIREDDALYRLAQGLLTLTRAAGRRALHLRRREQRWEVVGVTSTTLEYPPAALGLEADLPHQGHLRALLLAPLAVEVPGMSTGGNVSYEVAPRGVSTLVDALQVLAAALDEANAAAGSAWWGRARRVETANQAVARARTALRNAAGTVNATRKW